MTSSIIKSSTHSPYAGAESMPLDFSMLLGSSASSPASGEFLHHSPASYDTFLNDFGPCRRVATFPVTNRATPKPSNLKVRSMSESNKIHLNNDSLTLADLKRELANLIEEEKADEKIEEDENENDCPSQELGRRRSSISRHPHFNRKLSKSADATPPNERPKKRVAFADDHGLELFTVKVMTEPSDVPPKLSPSLLRHILGDMADEEARPASSWLVDFSQPACEYLRFRQLLDRQSVALENVVVKNDLCKMVGTVKVKNISFEKQVFVRFSDNHWQSFFDRPAVYQPGIEGDIYDTFAFDIDVPCDDERRDRIDFCVCYQANGREFWDSNDGKNYSLVSNSLKLRRDQTSFPDSYQTYTNKYADVCAIEHMDTWSGFASWKNLTTEGPYW